MNLPSLTKIWKLILTATFFILFVSSVLGLFLWIKSKESPTSDVSLSTKSPRPLSLPSLTANSQPVSTANHSLQQISSPSPVVNAHAPTDSDSGVAKEIKKEDPPTLLYTNDLGDKSLNLERKLVFFVMHDQQEKTEKVLSLAEVENKNLVEKFILIIQVENIVTINVYPEYTPNTQKTQVYYTWRK